MTLHNEEVLGEAPFPLKYPQKSEIYIYYYYNYFPTPVYASEHSVS